ncbi:N-acyl-D-amino-acid deacylase family protein [Pseudoalteromonas sp. GB56]
MSQSPQFKLRMMGVMIWAASLSGCASNSRIQIDTQITANNLYYDGQLQPGVLGINDGKIVFVGTHAPSQYSASNVLDAGNDYVVPGFIDPHTHACDDFKDTTANTNLNYLTQGVTTVVCNVDGGGEIDVDAMLSRLQNQGIGSNVAVHIGHGAVRRAVMGRENRAPNAAEMSAMKDLVEEAMQAGALGLSTGLYYVPGNYAQTNEVIELATVAAQYGGYYDSHIRDESSYSIGLVAAVDEVIAIAQGAKIPAHIAHIKALGVDVWGQSDVIVERIDAARARGLAVTADQYPWRASGTSIAGSLIPRKLMAGSHADYIARLNDTQQWPAIRAAMGDNLRRRGGAESLLITDPKHPQWRGKTLAQLASQWQIDAIDAAKKIIVEGENARVASFNMNQHDIDQFMQQAWVMTSSDGSVGHPRKFASFPKKFAEYVVERPVLSVEQYIHNSTTLTAQTLGLIGYGEIKEGNVADIAIFNPETFRPHADYLNPQALSSGVQWLFVNGEVAIAAGTPTEVLAGKAIRKNLL